MKYLRFFSFILFSAAIMFVGCDTGQSVAPEDTSAVLEKGGPTFTATLLGENEVPTGDPDGSGHATITILQNSDIRFEIHVADILLPATGAHIHFAAAGVAGPVVVPLTPPDETGMSSGVVENVDRELLKAIKKNPSDYYVNVHNSQYPAGAVRGQLER